MADHLTPPTVRIANPATIGLMGFGMTTILLSLHNAGALPLNAVILAMGFFCGGLAQFAAGLMEYRNGNTFGATAFTLYGAFWLVFVAIKAAPGALGADAATMGVFCLLWGVLTLGLFLGTLGGRPGLKIVFATLTGTFFLLAAADLSGVGTLTAAAGVLGLVCGAAAMYVAIAEVTAVQYGRAVLPY